MILKSVNKLENIIYVIIIEIKDSEGREFDSHLELGIFSQLSVVRILILPKCVFTVFVLYAGGRPISSKSSIQSSVIGIV